jgi:hypothetical protein
MTFLVAACASVVTSAPMTTDTPPPLTTEFPLPISTEPPYPMAAPMATPPLGEYPHPLTTLDPTGEAIVSAKATMAAEMEMTLAAQPTKTSSPTIPVDAPPCGAEDLSASINSDGAGGHILFFIRLANIGDKVCYLQNPPNIEFVTQEGNAVDGVRYYSVSDGQIGVGANTTVAVQALWSNWCRPSMTNAILRLVLPDDLGIFNLREGDFGGARCDAPNSESLLEINGFFYP